MQPTHAAHGGGQTGLLTPCTFRQIFEYDKCTLQKLRDHPAPKAMKEGWGIAYVSTACLPPAPMHAACARVRAHARASATRPARRVRINVAFTQDGSNLLVTDSTAVLHHLDPVTLEVVRSQTFKDRRVNFRPLRSHA